MEHSEYRRVFELQYMKKIRFSLNCLGLWPNKLFGDNSLRSRMLSFYNRFLSVCGFLCTMSAIMYLQQNQNVLEFIDLGHVFITILMSIIFFQRMQLFLQNKYHLITEEFVTKFHLIHFKNKSQFARKMNDQIEKICAIVTIVIHYQMYMGLSMYNIVPMYNNYKHGMYSAVRPANGTFEHSVYYTLPFDQYTDPYYYAIIFVFNWYVSYNVSCAFCAVDLLICTFVIHICGHLLILKHDLENFPQPKQRNCDQNPTLLYTADENRLVFQRLRDTIEHHKEIIAFMSITSDGYSITLCLYYAFHQLAGCVLLLECSSLTPEALGKYVPLTLIMFQQLIQISVFFELISSKGDTLVEAVYGLPWECMDVSNRKVVCLFLQNVQKSLALKAGDMVPVGVTTMSTILKTSFSYFLMLTTFTKN